MLFSINDVRHRHIFCIVIWTKVWIIVFFFFHEGSPIMTGCFGCAL